MLKKIVFGVSVATLLSGTAFSQTEIASASDAQVIVDAAIEETEAGSTEAASSSVTVAPTSVELKSWKTKKIWSKRPKIAIVGYNVGTYLTAKETASTGGGFGSSFGARSTLEYRVTNISPELIQDIADAAYADLQAQFLEAGAELVDVETITADPNISKLGVGSAPFQAKIKDGRAKKTVAVSGPSAFGGTSFMSMGKTTFNLNGSAKTSDGLDAVLVLPNAALDFVSTSGGGQRYFGNKARVEGTVGFSLDMASLTTVTYSKSGRYADGWGNLTLEEDIAVVGPFADVQEWSDELNGLTVGLSKTWGLPYTRAGKKVMGVTVEEAAYKDLALSVLKGYNAAIVADYNARK
ncbi:MAG: hypothetical protein AAFQ15_17520 [Pseudomonadota bacterium]